MADSIEEGGVAGQDRFQAFIARVLEVNTEDGEMPPDVIHELDQNTAALNEDLLGHGLDVRDPQVSATLAYVCSTVMDMVDEAVEDHAVECVNGAACSGSSVVAEEYIEDFVTLLGLLVRQALSTP